MMETGIEIEAMKNYGGSTSLKSKILSKEVSCAYCVPYRLELVISISKHKLLMYTSDTMVLSYV